MATFVSDTFTDTSATALESHTGETGATWVKNSTYAGGLVISDANRCRHVDDTSNAGYYASGTPAAADYEVQGTVRFLSDLNGGIGIGGRMSTSADTMYFAHYNNNAANEAFDLYKIVAGSYTQLGSSYSDPLGAGDERVMRLRMEGDQISLYVDDVLRIGPITDTALTVAGRAGIRAFLNATDAGGIHIDTFSATDIEAPGGAVIGAGLTTGLKLERMRLVA
jgi:hypothetical protein